MGGASLGQMLLEERILDATTLQALRDQQESSGLGLAYLVVRAGLAEPTRISALLGTRLALPPLALGRMTIPPDVARLVPEVLARMRRVLPVGLTSSGNRSVLRLAASDPTDDVAIPAVRRVTGCDLDVLLVDEAALTRKLDETYGQTAAPDEDPPLVVGTALLPTVENLPDVRARLEPLGPGEFLTASTGEFLLWHGAGDTTRGDAGVTQQVTSSTTLHTACVVASDARIRAQLREALRTQVPRIFEERSVDSVLDVMAGEALDLLLVVDPPADAQTLKTLDEIGRRPRAPRVVVAGAEVFQQQRTVRLRLAWPADPADVCRRALQVASVVTAS
ncbi:MAG: hypothetical protein AB2A00_23830 [Myxococcota bacterium]